MQQLQVKLSYWTIYPLLHLKVRVEYTVFMKYPARGFTLIELLIVIVILGVLYAISVIWYGSVLKSTRVAERAVNIDAIIKALELYRSDNDHYPQASGWRSECQAGGGLAADDVIPGLVPKYLKSFPSDPLMQKETNVSCYMYISNEQGNGYKILIDQINEMTWEDFMKIKYLIDPFRDEGSDSCKFDGDSPKSLSFYTANFCSY
jgi:prepilin-type N-terminal cleavage/methylation domain-containing protein